MRVFPPHRLYQEQLIGQDNTLNCGSRLVSKNGELCRDCRVVKMMSGPMVYFVDLIAVSGKIEMGKLQRFARVGVVLAGMVICAVICSLWAELHTSTLANLTANLACVVFYGTEAKAYGGRLKDS